MAYTYRTGESVLEGDTVLVATGSAKTNDLVKDLAVVTGYRTVPIPGTRMELAVVVVLTDDGRTVESSASRLQLIIR